MTTGPAVPVQKDRLVAVMEAVDALTSLGGNSDNETSSPTPSSSVKSNEKPSEDRSGNGSSAPALVVPGQKDQESDVAKAKTEATKGPPSLDEQIRSTLPPCHNNPESEAVKNGRVPKLAVPVPKQRHIPDHKKPNAALTFPEKLMHMMTYADLQGSTDPNFCIAWLPDGNSFVMRDPGAFIRDVVPLFFKRTKFESFTRKLYRWGFSQINRGAVHDPQVFGHDNFRRDDKTLMAKMRSVTPSSGCGNGAPGGKQQDRGLVPAATTTAGGGFGAVVLPVGSAAHGMQAQAQMYAPHHNVGTTAHAHLSIAPGASAAAPMVPPQYYNPAAVAAMGGGQYSSSGTTTSGMMGSAYPPTPSSYAALPSASTAAASSSTSMNPYAQATAAVDSAARQFQAAAAELDTRKAEHDAHAAAAHAHAAAYGSYYYPHQPPPVGVGGVAVPPSPSSAAIDYERGRGKILGQALDLTSCGPAPSSAAVPTAAATQSSVVSMQQKPAATATVAASAGHYYPHIALPAMGQEEPPPAAYYREMQATQQQQAQVCPGTYAYHAAAALGVHPSPTHDPYAHHHQAAVAAPVAAHHYPPHVTPGAAASAALVASSMAAASSPPYHHHHPSTAYYYPPSQHNNPAATTAAMMTPPGADGGVPLPPYSAAQAQDPYAAAAAAAATGHSMYPPQHHQYPTMAADPAAAAAAHAAAVNDHAAAHAHAAHHAAAANAHHAMHDHTAAAGLMHAHDAARRRRAAAAGGGAPTVPSASSTLAGPSPYAASAVMKPPVSTDAKATGLHYYY